jgi:hypothetical protein
VTRPPMPIQAAGFEAALPAAILWVVEVWTSNVSVWACGPLNLMKITPSRMQNRGSERRD